MSADWRLNIAYNAALQAATAALAASGHRASRDQHHYRVIQSLELTIQAGVAEIAKRVGYDAEAAFSKAFKRWIGVAPGAYRRGAESPGQPKLRSAGGGR